MLGRLLWLGWLLLPAVALAQTPVREGNMERLVLDDGLETDAAAWVVAEGSMAMDKKNVRRGDSALRLHIEVNWETGEAKYPVGWPRANRKWDTSLQDWAAWDFVEFSIYVETSRTSLPAEPMGLAFYDGAGARAYSRSLRELKIGQWADYRIPISELAGAVPCTGMQLHIAEANYRHGDVLDFWIDNISLVRYVEPTLAASRILEQVVTTRSGYVPLSLALMGLAAGKQTQVTWKMTRGGKVVAEGNLTAGRGTQWHYLPLPAKNVQAGEYELTLRSQGSAPAPLKFRVVGSPWEEMSK